MQFLKVNNEFSSPIYLRLSRSVESLFQSPQGLSRKYGTAMKISEKSRQLVSDWQQEALGILVQLQYTKQEAANMIETALARSHNIDTTEELLNEIYKQRVKS